MKLTMPGYLLLVLAIILLIYFIFIGRVFLLTQGLDAENRVSKSQKNITVSIPKQARVGDKIEVIVYYYPRLFAKSGLSRIVFFDDSGAYNYKKSLDLDKFESGKVTFPYSLDFLPKYESFILEIPKEVCKEEPVNDTCSLITTKIGKGTVTLIYYPILSKLVSDGYQGNGMRIEVPITITK